MIAIFSRELVYVSKLKEQFAASGKQVKFCRSLASLEALLSAQKNKIALVVLDLSHPEIKEAFEVVHLDKTVCYAGHLEGELFELAEKRGVMRIFSKGELAANARLILG
ncbi:MAG TPA: hypothetical protein PKD37_06945 [Oligoflexia bacterium]|nr:hypothetical protein [Oligoflexia bacterium]HMP27700.1 hypothetical protein [Oligoflexia bacterium]